MRSSRSRGSRGSRASSRSARTPPTGPGRRTPEWQKVKLRQQDDLPIVGYTRGTGKRGKLGALVLARREPDGLHWAGNVGSGIGDGDVDRLLEALRPLERPDEPARGHPADAARPRLGRDLGRAGAGGRGGLRRADPRGTAASSGVPGVTRRRPGGTPCHGHEDRARSPDARADEPRQAVLAGGGDHEGRAARVLPRRRRGARSPPAPAAVHDEALPRRLAGEELLPEAGAVAHARLDRDCVVPGIHARGRAAHDRLRARRRRPRPPVDGEHGLHRHARVGVPRRQAATVRTGSCSISTRPRGRPSRT